MKNKDSLGPPVKNKGTLLTGLAVLFSAWGMAGLLMTLANGRITDLTGTNELTYFIIIGMLPFGGILLFTAGLTFVSRRLQFEK